MSLNIKSISYQFNKINPNPECILDNMNYFPAFVSQLHGAVIYNLNEIPLAASYQTVNLTSNHTVQMYILTNNQAQIFSTLPNNTEYQFKTNMTSFFSDMGSWPGQPVVNNLFNMISTNKVLLIDEICLHAGDSQKPIAPFCPSKATSMVRAYEFAILSGSPVCGPSVRDMTSAQSWCHVPRGSSPVCGPNVVNMDGTYQHCLNLTGSPVCGPSVINMHGAQESSGVTGSPACGNQVQDMSRAYYNCYNLTGSPVCGPNVTNMTQAQGSCYRLIGPPVCGNNVIDMSRAQEDCRALTGSMQVQQNKLNAWSCFDSMQDASERLRIDIYANQNHEWKTNLHMDNARFVGIDLEYTQEDEYNYYNTMYNIYLHFTL